MFREVSNTLPTICIYIYVYRHCIQYVETCLLFRCHNALPHTAIKTPGKDMNHPSNMHVISLDCSHYISYNHGRGS